MKKMKIDKWIRHFNKDQLLDLIEYLVSVTESGEEAVIDYCQKKASDGNVTNQALIIEKKIRQHWNHARKIIDDFNEYGGGPESEEEKACDELNAMSELVECDDASWNVRKEILDDILDNGLYGNSGFTDYLMDIASSMCRSREEQLYLANGLSKWGDHYYKDVALRIYLKNGEEQKFLEMRMGSLQYGSDYLELAEYYETRHEEEKAFQIVMKGLDQADGRIDELFNYLFRYCEKKGKDDLLETLYEKAKKRDRNSGEITEQMYHYYQKNGNYIRKKETLLELISYGDSGRLYERYQECRQELTEEDFAGEETKILALIKERKLPVYLDILMDKGETGEVLKYILQYSGKRWQDLDENHYFSKRLSEKYPVEIVELYWKEAAHWVGLGKEKNYAHAVGVLIEIKKIMDKNKWPAEWDARYAAFREEHRRKRLLMEQLERLKI